MVGQVPKRYSGWESLNITNSKRSCADPLMPFKSHADEDVRMAERINTH